MRDVRIISNLFFSSKIFYRLIENITFYLQFIFIINFLYQNFFIFTDIFLLYFISFYFSLIPPHILLHFLYIDTIYFILFFFFNTISKIYITE